MKEFPEECQHSETKRLDLTQGDGHILLGTGTVRLDGAEQADGNQILIIMKGMISD